jgi:hypothetical protein
VIRLEQAKDLAAIGFSIIPLAFKEKRPNIRWEAF